MISALTSADHRVLLWINGFAGHFTRVDWVMSHLANDYFIPAMIGLIAFGLWFTGHSDVERRRNQWGFIYAAAGVGISAGIVSIINAHYFRPRPYVLYPEILPTVHRLFYEPTVSSFPAFPAALTFAFAFGVWLQNRKVGWSLAFLALLMSFARIYVGVHYPSDIVGGAVIGIAITYAFYWVVKPLKPLINIGFMLMERLFLA